MREDAWAEKLWQVWRKRAVELITALCRGDQGRPPARCSEHRSMHSLLRHACPDEHGSQFSSRGGLGAVVSCLVQPADPPPMDPGTGLRGRAERALLLIRSSERGHPRARTNEQGNLRRGSTSRSDMAPGLVRRYICRVIALEARTRQCRSVEETESLSTCFLLSSTISQRRVQGSVLASTISCYCVPVLA